MTNTVEELLIRTGLEPELIKEIVAIGRLKKIESDQLLVDPDSPGGEIPFVMTGLLKVMRQDENGNEVFLYYLEGGETCAMSITCCIEGRKS